MTEPDLQPSVLQPLATAVGTSWADELMRSLRSDGRAVVGAWPGTLGEARMRMRVALRRHIDAQLLDELAHVANLAARRGWLCGATFVRVPLVKT